MMGSKSHALSLSLPSPHTHKYKTQIHSCKKYTPADVMSAWRFHPHLVENGAGRWLRLAALLVGTPLLLLGQQDEPSFEGAIFLKALEACLAKDIVM